MFQVHVYTVACTVCSRPHTLTCAAFGCYSTLYNYAVYVIRFPDSLGDRLHRTHCFLPHPLSQMMSCDSQLVAAAVHILCDRDPADMKVCRTMERFSPRKYDFVMTEVCI